MCVRMYSSTSNKGHSERVQSKSSLLYTLHTKYPLKEDKRLGPEHVHYSEVSLYVCVYVCSLVAEVAEA